MKQYGDLESVLAHAGEVPARPTGRIGQHADAARFPASWRRCGRTPLTEGPATFTGRLPTGRRSKLCTPSGNSVPSPVSAPPREAGCRCRSSLDNDGSNAVLAKGRGALLGRRFGMDLRRGADLARGPKLLLGAGLSSWALCAYDFEVPAPQKIGEGTGLASRAWTLRWRGT